MKSLEDRWDVVSLFFDNVTTRANVIWIRCSLSNLKNCTAETRWYGRDRLNINCLRSNAYWWKLIRNKASPPTRKLLVVHKIPKNLMNHIVSKAADMSRTTIGIVYCQVFVSKPSSLNSGFDKQTELVQSRWRRQMLSKSGQPISMILEIIVTIWYGSIIQLFVSVFIHSKMLQKRRDLCKLALVNTNQ